MAFMNSERLARGSTLGILSSVLGTVLAVGAVWLSANVHLERACFLTDTPYLPLCADEEHASIAQRQQRLRDYLSRNPGDSGAWVSLTNIETGPYEGALFHAASTLAPTEPNVMMWRAGKLLAANDLVGATALLVQIVEFRHRDEAAQALARIVATREGTELLRPYLGTAGKWLPRVIANLAGLKLPLGSALTLMAEASAKGTVTQGTIQAYIKSLKSAGNWGDAYSLWLAQQRGPRPLLHNGSFEQRFELDSFDWEITPEQPSRAGAAIAQRSENGRGQVLDINFTGKPVPTPMIRHYVFLAPGNYVLRGQYMATKLRMEQGLAWTVQCSNRGASNATAGRSEGLLDTAGAWKSFEVRIRIPSDCGLVASLQLETFAPFEAATGFKGRAAFDALELRAEPI